MTEQNYNQTIALFLSYFLMYVTHCNMGLVMGKFWMLPVVTMAHQSVKSPECIQSYLHAFFLWPGIHTMSIDVVTGRTTTKKVHLISLLSNV